MTLPRPGHADLAGVMKYGLADVRDALERASARHTAAIVAAGGGRQGAAARDRRHRGRLGGRGGRRRGDGIGEAIDAARSDRDTLGGIVEVRARGVPPGLGLVRDEGGAAGRAPCLDAARAPRR